MPAIYRGPRAEVWHADALDALAEIPTESAGLVITDPPYGVEWQSNVRAQQFDLLDNDTAGDRAGIRAVLAEAVRVVAQHRHLYVFGPVDILDGLKVTEPVALVWDKGTIGLGDLASRWGPQHEPISFVVSCHRHAGKAGSTSLAARLRKGSVISAPRPTGRTVRHPSEKPIALLRELVESSSRPEELVVDPFGGIGSTAVAAVLAGRRAITIDTSAEWSRIAVDRVRAAERVYLEGASL